MSAVELTKTQNKSEASDVSGPSGEGLILLDVDYETGRVTEARILRTTGHKSVDENALAVVRRWRFKPKTYKQIRVPISVSNLFSASDVEKYLASKSPGKNIVIYAPPPRYPMQMLQMGASAHGKYQLSVRPDGTVSNVKTVETTGDRRFDQSVISALRIWRFRPGALSTVIIPIAFNFNHGHYSVELR